MKTNFAVYLLISSILATFGSHSFHFKRNKTEVIITDNIEEVLISESLNTFSSYDDYKHAYFYNLRHNFGKNVFGSCGAVAIEMVLTYYDSFVSDNIVPENYDVKCISYDRDTDLVHSSPGSLDESNYISSSYGGDDINAFNNYLNDVEAIINTSLHAKIVQLIKDNNYSTGTNFGVNDNDLDDLIVDLLHGEFGLTANDFSVSAYYRNGLGANQTARNYAIESLNQGKPVILGLTNSFFPLLGSGHYVVAYKYNQNEDKIYAHFGYHGNYYYVDVGSSYNYIDSATVIDFANMTHNHSDNYLITSLTQSFCYDDNNIFTYNHDEHLRTNYSFVDYTKHNKICWCGEIVSTKHTVPYSQIRQGLLNYTCVYCGHTLPSSGLYYIDYDL